MSKKVSGQKKFPLLINLVKCLIRITKERGELTFRVQVLEQNNKQIQPHQILHSTFIWKDFRQLFILTTASFLNVEHQGSEG